MTVGIVILHDLENQTSFEGLVRHEGDGCGDVAAVDADHVGMLVITKVTHFLGFLVPGVPDDRVGEVVLLDPHLPPRHHVGHDVLVRSVDVNPEIRTAVKSVDAQYAPQIFQQCLIPKSVSAVNEHLSL